MDIRDSQRIKGIYDNTAKMADAFTRIADALERLADRKDEPTSCKTCRYGEVDEGYVRCAYYSKADRKTENSSEKPNNSKVSEKPTGSERSSE